MDFGLVSFGPYVGCLADTFFDLHFCYYQVISIVTDACRFVSHNQSFSPVRYGPRLCMSDSLFLLLAGHCTT